MPSDRGRFAQALLCIDHFRHMQVSDFKMIKYNKINFSVSNEPPTEHSQSAFYVNLYRAVIGPSG